MSKPEDMADSGDSYATVQHEEYNPSSKGPIKNRSCTDVICCALFIVFLLGLVVVAYFGFVFGNPKLVMYPNDTNGNMCGLGEQKDKEFLLFFDLVKCGSMGARVVISGCPTPQVCVKQCPSKNYVYTEDLSSQNKDNLICRPGTNKSKTVQQLVDANDCAAYYLKSEPVMNRCFPIKKMLNLVQGGNVVVHTDHGDQTIVSSNGNISTGSMTHALNFFQHFLKLKAFGELIIADVIVTWWMILIVLSLSSLISFLWIFLMRWLAGPMIWLTIIAFLGIFGFGSGFCFYQYVQNRGSNDVYTLYLATMTLKFEKEKLFLAMGIIASIIFVIVFLILLILCQRIRIAIELLKEGSKALGCMKFTMIWPIFPFLGQLCIIAFWLLLAVYLATVGRAQNLSENNITFPNGSINVDAVEKNENLFDIICEKDQNESDDGVCELIIHRGGEYVIYLQVYNLIMAIWLVNFVVAFEQMTLSGAFASYYWALNKTRDIPTLPLLSSFWRTVRYHLGTIAFGAIIITLIQVARLTLEYLDAKLKGTENPVAQFILKCMKCCFWCLEKFLKFLNKNAYIMCAIYGNNFCSSAKKAFYLIMRNVVRVLVVDNVTDFLLFTGKLVVVGAVGVASFFFFDGRINFLKAYVPTLNFYLVPIVVVILGSYVIASCFFSVYEMAVNTLFLCFLEDLETNDGSKEKPYFMNKSLMKLLGKKTVSHNK